MSTPASAVVAPASVQDARQKVLTTDFFALCYLMLANLSYSGETDGKLAIDHIRKLLPTMPIPQGTVQGKWSLAWGPQASADNSNLMYVARFSDSGSNLPVFLTVAIRGTDTSAKPAGVLQQIVQDLDAGEQVVFPAGNQQGSRIAKGSQNGLDALNHLQDPATGQAAATYLQGFVTQNPDVPIVVTGHSLGGCMTTVVALDLASKLPGAAKIVPNSFAAPSAGNAAFIRLYEQRFPRSPRWFNAFDLVPRAYAGLSDIKNLWTDCKRPAPTLVKIANEGLELVLEKSKVSYVQQSPVNSRQLPGACQANQKEAVAPAKKNQAVAEIQTLLENQVNKLAHAGQLPEVLKRLGGDVGNFFEGIAADLVPAEKLAAKIIAHFSVGELTSWVSELLFQHSVLTGYWNAVKSANGVAEIPNPFPEDGKF